MGNPTTFTTSGAMLTPKIIHHILAALCTVSIITSCAEKKTERPLTVMPVTSSVEITLDETRIPDTCQVFGHLIIIIPAQKTIADVTTAIRRYGMNNGADFILIGLTRESTEEPGSVLFQTYGPETPYSFKKRWLGWKYGFSDWNSGGPLIDYGHDRIGNDNAPLFDVPVDAQAVLLSCPAQQ